MLTDLSAIILSIIMATSPGRWCLPDCEERADVAALQLEGAAEAAEVPLPLLAALAESETGFNDRAVGGVGEVGMLQLHPKSPWGRAARAECRGLTRLQCSTVRVFWGARALRIGLEECRRANRAISWYKSGRCQDGPIGKRVARRAKWFARQLADR